MSLESGKVYGITSLLSELAFKLGDDGKSVVGHPFEENLNQKVRAKSSFNGPANALTNVFSGPYTSLKTASGLLDLQKTASI